MKIFVSAISVLSLTLMGCPGAECSESTPCAEGQQCTAEGICVTADAGPVCDDTSHPEAPNLIKNPGFECGVGSWLILPAASIGTVSVDTANPKSGENALRFQVTTGGLTKATIASDPVDVSAGDTLCARAWFRGTVSNVFLGIRELGRLNETTFPTPDIDVNNWVVNPTSNPLKLEITEDQQVDLRMIVEKPVEQDTLFVDDLALWKSPDGSCSER